MFFLSLLYITFLKYLFNLLNRWFTTTTQILTILTACIDPPKRGYSTFTSSKFTVDVFLAKCFLPFSHAINTSNTGIYTSVLFQLYVINTSDTGIYTSILFQLYVINTSNTGIYTSSLIYMNIYLQLIRFCTVCIGF